MGASARRIGPGERLGKYELIRQLAIGGMAELYLARAAAIEGFEKLVAVKRMLPELAERDALVAMFLQEARMGAQLHHPNIAQVFDIGGERGDYFFSMEYVHGENLGVISAVATDSGVPMSLDAALTLCAGLCAGLHYAHDKVGPDGRPLHVVHRDVSPSNVLVTYDGAVKLVDFGIARAASTRNTISKGLKGKAAYMSPEQIHGGEVDRRSDLFSVGALFYELSTGQQPFRGETPFEVLEKIVSTDVVPPSAIVPSYPEALERIVLRAMQRDPAKRYATALEMQGELEDFAHESRLRVSPLVLARLMSALFPARLEEWERARSQGGFFVEQAVVRTWIEKTGDAAPPELGVPVAARNHDDDTDVGVVPISTPISEVGEVTTPLPFTAVTMPGFDPATMRIALPRGGDDQTQFVRFEKKSPTKIIIAVGAIVIAAALAAVIVMTRGGSNPAPTKPAKVVTPTPPPTAQQTSVPDVVPVPAPAPDPSPTPQVVAPTPPTPSNAPPTTTVRAPTPKPTPAPVVVKKPAPVYHPAPTPPVPQPPAPQPKKETWQTDDPFLPHRPGT